MAKKRSRKSKEGSWPPPMQGQQDEDFEDPQNPDGWHPPLLSPKPKPGPWAPDDPDFEDPQQDQDPHFGPFDIPRTTPTFTAPNWPPSDHERFGPLRDPGFWGLPDPPDPTPTPGGFEDETIPDPMAQQTGSPRQRPRRKTKGPSKKTKAKSKTQSKRSRGRGKGK